MNKVAYILMGALIALSDITYCQYSGIPIYDFQAHPSFFRSQNLTWDGSSKIYSSSGQAIMEYNISNGALSAITTKEGLSDVNITTLNYGNNSLLIGYNSGYVDIIEDNTVFNINSLVRATSISGSKKINDFDFYNNTAFVSTDAGILELRLDQKDFRDSYTNIGRTGGSPVIYSAAVNPQNNKLYAATAEGLKIGELANNTNLIDFNNWFHSSVLRPSSNEQMDIAFRDTSLIIMLSKSGIYQYESDTNYDTLYIVPAGEEIQNFTLANEIYFNLDDSLYTIDSDDNTSGLSTEGLILPKDVLWPASGDKFFIADEGIGLHQLKKSDFEIENTIILNSPLSNNAFKLEDFEKNMVVLPGGYSGRMTVQLGRNQGVHAYQTSFWSNYVEFFNNFPKFFDPIRMVYSKTNGKLYFASFGYGLLETNASFSNGFRFDNTNSSLNQIIDPVGDALFVRLTGVVEDSQGKIWMSGNTATSTVNYTLYEYDPIKGRNDSLNAITDYSQSPASLIFERNLDMVIDNNDQIWVNFRSQGLGVFKQNQDGTFSRRTFEQGDLRNLPNPTVNCMHVDLDGNVWVGTNNGVAVFFNTSLAISDPDYAGSWPIFEGRPLLRDQIINAIDTDGANRKWIATAKGLWLFDQNGSEPLRFIDSENSPITDDNILDVEVQQQTGEVFIATADGIFSFRSDATEADEEEVGEVRVFPNPVRLSQHSYVAIDGLARNSEVKITDISGNKVFEGRANGGMITWDLKDNLGYQPKEGIYLVFSATSAGEGEHVAKFAVVQ